MRLLAEVLRLLEEFVATGFAFGFATVVLLARQQRAQVSEQRPHFFWVQHGRLYEQGRRRRGHE